MPIEIPEFITKQAVVRPDLLAETPDPRTDVTAEEWNALHQMASETAEVVNGISGSSTPSDATPQPLGTAAAGDSSDYSRGNHVHAHGDLAGGTLHADAIASGAAGFMSGSDKAKLNGIEAGADVTDFANVQAALGAATGNVDLNGNKFTGVDGPSAGQDVANKTYVDDQDTATLGAAQAYAEAAVATPLAPITETGTTRAMAGGDHGRTVLCTNGSGCEVTVPTGLTPGTTAEYVGSTSGPVTIVAGGGMTLRYSADFIAESHSQWSPVIVTILPSGTDALVRGDLTPA